MPPIHSVQPAVEQLMIWGERVGVPVVKQKMGADPASVAFDTLSSAVANNADVVIIDTAGRLHNKVGLMNEPYQDKERHEEGSTQCTG